MAGDGETVTPSLPEPDAWTGTACADVSGPLRWKRAKTIEARGGDVVQPHQEAGYTSAVVAVDPDQAGRCNRAGSISLPLTRCSYTSVHRGRPVICRAPSRRF